MWSSLHAPTLRIIVAACLATPLFIGCAVAGELARSDTNTGLHQYSQQEMDSHLNYGAGYLPNGLFWTPDAA